MESEEIGGRYRVIERIGKGAMGVVFKAYDPVLDRVVAIKKMAAEIGQDEELRQRFYVEARAAARLNHRNIVTIHELEESDGEIYIVMELLEGLDLASVIRRRVPLPLDATLSIVGQLCEGLDYAHRHGIVHRDIKPGNLHLGPGGLVKILDFGIARLASSKMTGTGALLGTPDYMSPEQVLGQDIDARSDLFAVGGVLYELLASTKPFESESVASLLIKIAKSPHVPITDRVSDLPIALVSLVNRLLAKDRDLRPATAGAVLAELRVFLQSSSGASEAAAAAVIGGIVTEQTLAMGGGQKTTLPPAATPRPGTPRPAAASVPPRDPGASPVQPAAPPESSSSDRLASLALQRGRELRKSGDLAGAMQVFRSVLEVAPGNAEALAELQAIEADVRQATTRPVATPSAPDVDATVLKPRGPEPAPPSPPTAAASPAAAPAASKSKSGAALAIAAVLLVMAAAGGGGYYLLLVKRASTTTTDATSSAAPAPPATSSAPSVAAVSTSTSAPEVSPSTTSAPAPSESAQTSPAAEDKPATPASTVVSTTPAAPAPAADPERAKAEAARDRLVALKQARAVENAPPLPMRMRNEAMRFERQGMMAFTRQEYARAATFFEEAGRLVAMRERPSRGNPGPPMLATPGSTATPSAPTSGGARASNDSSPSKPGETRGGASSSPPAETPTDPPTLRTPAPREGVGDISTFNRGAPRGVDQMFNATPSVRATIARIVDLIERYARAMETRNLETLRAVRTELNPQEERIVRGRQITYRLEDLNVRPNGPEATATARRTVTGEVDSGTRLNVSGPVTIRLVRRPAGWIITDVR